MTKPKNSKKSSLSALAEMSEKMSAMMSDDNSTVENTDVKMPVADDHVQTEETAQGSELQTVEVNINIEKTQGNAIYSALLGVQTTLNDFKLDVKEDSLKEVVSDAFSKGIKEYYAEVDAEEKKREEKLRAEGKPANNFELYQQVVQRETDAINTFNKNSHVIQEQYKGIADRLCEMLGRINFRPYEKPKFKDDSGHILLNSLYLYPWYCFKCVYSSKYVRSFFKTVAWSIWLVTLGLLFFIARDNTILQKQQNINRYIHAYFSDNAEVSMELEGIDLMFTNQDDNPIPVSDYRKYMKERKKESKKDRTK